MKRSVWIAALALVLGLGTLIFLGVRLGRTAVPVGMEALHPYGDSAAAEGLTVHTVLGYGQRMRWSTDYRPAEGTEESRFSFRPQNAVERLTGQIVENEDVWYLTCMCVTDTGEYVRRDLLIGDESWVQSRTVRVADAFAAYSICLTPYGQDTAFVRGRSDEEIVPFDKLRIPVGEEDQVGMTVYFDGAGGGNSGEYSFEYNFINQETRAQAYSLGRDGHTLVTVGFAPDAPVESSWAPEGFGLWDVPVADREVPIAKGAYINRVPAADQARLVYPLDIVRQRVVGLCDSADGDILLVTAEDGRFVLRALDSGTYRLKTELDLGAAETTSWKEGEREVVNYAYVGIRPEEGFTLIALGSRELLVLEPTEEGQRIALRSHVMELQCIHDFDRTRGGDQWGWQEAGASDAGEIFNPVWAGYFSMDRMTVDVMTAVSYRDGTLALACRPLYSSENVLLEVYGDGGMRYGAMLENGLEGQVYSERYSLQIPWTEDPLRLRWED